MPLHISNAKAEAMGLMASNFTFMQKQQDHIQCQSDRRCVTLSRAFINMRQCEILRQTGCWFIQSECLAMNSPSVVTLLTCQSQQSDLCP